MTDPRNTDPYPGPNLNDTGGGSTWAWIAGIAVVILVAFIVAAFWNGNPRTASNAPTDTTGMASTATHPTPAPATTGQGAGAPAIAPDNMAPKNMAPKNMAPDNMAPQKTTPPTTPAPATPATK